MLTKRIHFKNRLVKSLKRKNRKRNKKSRRLKKLNRKLTFKKGGDGEKKCFGSITGSPEVYRPDDGWGEERETGQWGTCSKIGEKVKLPLFLDLEARKGQEAKGITVEESAAISKEKKRYLDAKKSLGFTDRFRVGTKYYKRGLKGAEIICPSPPSPSERCHPDWAEVHESPAPNFTYDKEACPEINGISQCSPEPNGLDTDIWSLSTDEYGNPQTERSVCEYGIDVMTFKRLNGDLGGTVRRPDILEKLKTGCTFVKPSPSPAVSGK